MTSHYVTALGLLLLLLPPGLGFSWRSEPRPAVDFRGKLSPITGSSPSKSTKSRSILPEIYQLALHELQELESEPFCHRVAARLLVTNCHLLDGKDEASVLTDSGRRIRDFVDSYAASLAICDLERGSFTIPAYCSPFREATLSQLPIQGEPHLHVSSRQIENCLTGLAGSDSAWNTWVSYRHKAVRFCEAARADNEKAQSILLYQRLTKVIAKLADGVEQELQKRMDDLDLRARKAGDAIEQLSPQIDKLRDGLHHVHDYLSRDLRDTLTKSADQMHQGLENAENLQQLLAVLLKTAIEGNSQVASAHEQSVERATRRAGDEMAVFLAAIASAVASSVSLQNEIELSRLQATDLTSRQEALEKGMNHLMKVTTNLTSTYHHHAHLLDQANNATNELMDTIEATVSSANQVHESLSRRYEGGGWWPYIVCPTASLVMGSYGLPPSAFRNLALVALGEMLGILVATYNHFSNGFPNFNISAVVTSPTPTNSSLVTDL